MNEYPDIILNKLRTAISKVTAESRNFVTNPKTDFTRKRKLSLNEMIHIILSMGGQSLKLELLEYFAYDSDTASSSAFVQQREKILPELFNVLFHQFTSMLSAEKNFKGYRMFSVDGSDLNIAHNPNDKSTYRTNGGKKGFNLLHLNAMYDLCNRIYIDSIVQTNKSKDERKALISMVERANIIDEKVILVADRGYESYNVFEHISQRGWKYVIRIKDILGRSIASNMVIDEAESFDINYSVLLTRRQTKEIKKNKQLYRFLSNKTTFDFLPSKSKEMYPMNFRLVRFKVSDNSYELLITNLSKDEFSLDDLKMIYKMRWGIETSFRELKYALGLTNFHSKKVAYIIQEIFSRLTMYNFCEIITTHIVVKQKDRKHTYQVNFTLAIAVCMRFFRCKNDIRPPNVEALIQKNILPIRPDRKDPRKVRVRSSVSFLYRVV